jgi:hypothetical protein
MRNEERFTNAKIDFEARGNWRKIDLRGGTVFENFINFSLLI